jgi:hypothetical protein
VVTFVSLRCTQGHVVEAACIVELQVLEGTKRVQDAHPDVPVSGTYKLLYRDRNRALSRCPSDLSLSFVAIRRCGRSYQSII